MNYATKTVRLLLGTLLLLFAAAFASAQTNQGQIAGNVVDASGAAVPNAEITAKGDQTGVNYTAKSTSSGNYRFPSIQLGRYTITATAPGFKSTVSTGVEVRVGTVSSLDITLSAGGASDTVTVTSNAPTVEAESSDVGGTVNTRQIVELPLALGGVGALRAPESFVFLIPGTVGPGSGNSNNGVFISQIGGGQNFGNEVLLDGASQTRSENGSSFDEEAPSVEAISEFKVTTSTPAAEFGRTTGGIENFVTKSGSNAFHGTVYDIFRNEDLNANDWFNNGRKAFLQSQNDPTESRYNRGNDKQNDYGGNLGGPVFIPHIYNGRDKLFFFFNWEQYRHTLGGPITSTVPTAAERGGNFTDLLGSQRFDNNGNPILNPCDGTPLFNGQIFDPATTRTVNGVQCRTAFANNTIPQGRISPIALKLLAFYPNPTSPATSGNYTLNTSSPLTNTTYSVRVDSSVGSKDKIYGSYNTRENTRFNPQNFQLPAPVTPNVQTQDFLTHFGRAGWDHIFSPNWLNHLNVGYNRSNSINGSVYLQGGTNYTTQLGIPGLSTGFPHVGGNGYVDLSRNQNGDNIDNGIRVNDSVSWQKGRNSFKFGVDYRYQQYSTLGNDQTNGSLNFSGNQTKVARTSPYQDGTGLAQASFLLGLTDSGSLLQPNHQPRWISNYWGGFFQDDFKASNSLVLNIGVRYDIDQPRKEAQNFTSNFSPTAIDPYTGTPGALVFATTCNNCNKRWADTWKKDIAPRIGFAYSPASLNNKFVLRGGFAVLYGPLQYSDFGGATTVGYNSPVNLNSDGFNPSFNLSTGFGNPSFAPNLDPGFFDNRNSAAPRNFSNYIKPSYGRPPMIEQWNLQIQQELAKDLIFTLGYIGNEGAHLRSGIENVNNTSLSTLPLGDILSRQFGTVAPALGTRTPYAGFNTSANYFQALRPFPQYDFIATDCCLQNVGHSSYHALIASLERRFSQGLNLQASYTWSKHITNADSSLPGINGGVVQEQNPENPKSTKSLSVQDIPNTFVVSYIYELPFGKGKAFGNFKNPLLRAAVSGFEIGGVQRYQSGQPVSFQCASGIPGFQNCIDFTRVPGSSIYSNARTNGHINPFRRFQYQYLNPGKPDRGPDPNVDSEFNGLTNTGNAAYSQFQTAPAFYDQNNSNNRRTRAVLAGDCPLCDNGGFLLGNVPRVSGEIRNYRYLNEDFSFLKKTPLTEGTVFTLKVEVLNAFNRHAFQTQNDNVFNQPYNNQFGVPTATINGPRQLQITGRIQF
ncbi:carboxypeptidase regulatory-like domain-containing protein [Terriglobus sp.]|uniref:carboxypeptidase regulatory-like domain-containing protein n=1 Tax=Terriglobus sp. TaxID=1889013 RepID=UPI003AFF6C66